MKLAQNAIHRRLSANDSAASTERSREEALISRMKIAIQISNFEARRLLIADLTNPFRNNKFHACRPNQGELTR